MKRIFPTGVRKTLMALPAFALLVSAHIFGASSVGGDPPPESEAQEAVCTECHESSHFVPSYHDGGWLKRHGTGRELGMPTAHGRDCGACHPGDACTQCHRRMPPASHTGFWRTRGHGLRAGFDRRSCRTCHAEPYCIRCHRESPPLNHRGDWQSRHGRAGADPASPGRCFVCHGLPGHAYGRCGPCH